MVERISTTRARSGDVYTTRAPPHPTRSRRVHKCMVIRYGNEDSISSNGYTFGKEGALDLQPSRRTTERWIARKIMPALGNGINIDASQIELPNVE